MSFSRAIFAFALAMLVAGFFASRMVADYLFGNTSAQTISVVAESSSHTPTPTLAASPTARARVLATATPAFRMLPTRTPTPRPTATSISSPTPTPTSGTVTLASYWVGTRKVRRGQMVEIGYVISNGTGHAARVFLGASVKSSNLANWATGALSDTAHDVIAIAPPGTSTHVRYFAFPYRARPGVYDVAWGLRDARSGLREALVTAAAAVDVTR